MVTRLRSFISIILRTSWLCLVLFLTLVFMGADIGSLDQGQSGLISIARGENGRWLTCAWFLSALSVVTLPFFFLWQEQNLTTIERSGFLPLLLTSRLPERRYRARRLTTGVIGVCVVAAFTALIGALTLGGLDLPFGGPGNFLLASLVIHVPNLVFGMMLAAFLTRMEERAVALAIGIAAPLSLILLFGLTSSYVPEGLLRLFYVSIEPSATLFFSELYRSSTEPGWGSPQTIVLMPLLLNRAIVTAASVLLARRYLGAPSVFERSPRAAGRTPPAFVRRLRPFTVSLSLALIAALMTVSNVHSNFSKNLTLYEIDPSMGFLFAAALGDIHVYLVAAMILLMGKLVWDSRESGFDVLEMSGRLTGPRLISRAATQLAVAMTTFTLIVTAAIAAMFAGHWDALSLSALVEYAALRWLPGFLLIGSIFYVLSLLSPNRVMGYLTTITCTIAYLFARSAGFLELPITPFASAPAWSPLTERASWEPAALSDAAIRLGMTLAIAAVASFLAGRWRRTESSWVSRRTVSGSTMMAVAGTMIIILSAFIGGISSSEDRQFENSSEAAARYETATAEISSPSAWTAVAVDHLLRQGNDGTALLSSTLKLVRQSPGDSRIPITWGVRPEQIQSIKIDGRDTGIDALGPGLFQIESPADEVELTLQARVSGSSRDAVAVDSFHGSWPTMPVVGVLPELFVRDHRSRRDLGLPAEMKPVELFHSDGLSRRSVQASVGVDHPCARAGAVPYAPVRYRAGDDCNESVSRPAVRNELFVASGLWDRLERSGDGGRLTLLFPSHQPDVARLFLDSSMTAREAVADALGQTDPLDLTIAAGGVRQIGSSNALSKPGLILVSDVMVLDTALRQEERRRRFTTLMAHEIAHQWFGPARTGVPGAVFVNEVPAELVRGYVALQRFGEAGYRDYLDEVRGQMYYAVRTQRTPDGPPLDAVESDEIYYRAAILGAFIAGRIGWNGLLDNLAAIASERSAAEPSTSRELAPRLLRGLDGRDLEFARLLIETDTTFEWRRDGLSVSCHENCSETPPLFPTRVDGSLVWLPPDDVRLDDLHRSPIGPLVLGARTLSTDDI